MVFFVSDPKKKLSKNDLPIQGISESCVRNSPETMSSVTFGGLIFTRSLWLELSRYVGDFLISPHGPKDVYQLEFKKNTSLPKVWIFFGKYRRKRGSVMKMGSNEMGTVF